MYYIAKQNMIATKNKVVFNNLLNYILYDDLDSENRLFVSWETFDVAMAYIHNQVNTLQEQDKKSFDAIYALPRGGLCLGVKLSYLTGIPLITDTAKITSQTLIVDDCTDTGQTLSQFARNTIAVMFHKPTSIVKPSIYFQETDKQINFCWESKEERN